MKKTIHCALFLAFLLASNTLFSQTDWQWDDHGVGFSAPSNLRITTNNAEEFTAEGSDIMLSIYVEQNGEVSEENLADALVAAAREMAYDDITAVEALEIDDFTGYYVEGIKDGMGAFILTLLDMESSTNLVVVLVYTTDEARDKAVDIANSFYAFD